MPEVVGEMAEIIDLQIQEFENYTVYPVWVRMLSGKHEGKIYGFRYDDIEETTPAFQGEQVRVDLVEQLEDILREVTASQPEAGKSLCIGDTVKIKKCESLPDVVGESADIVNLQIQDGERYAVYPVWVKITSGARQGKIYGFHYDEIETRPSTQPQEAAKLKVMEQLEELLQTMKTGGTVRVKNCDALPDLIGQDAEIIDIQTQENERYATYPVWVKISSGDRKGKIYGFHCDEIEVMPQALPKCATKIKMVGHLEELIKGITKMDKITEIEKAIQEVKGKVTGMSDGFWEGKTPCWDMFRCPKEIRDECPAYRYQELPCWEIEGTYSKMCGGGNGHDTDICRSCRVYKRWGNNERIEIKLHGQGLNQPVKA
jgi:hypothetical protein